MNSSIVVVVGNGWRWLAIETASFERIDFEHIRSECAHKRMEQRNKTEREIWPNGNEMKFIIVKYYTKSK